MLYAAGITAMELAKAHGTDLPKGALLTKILRAIVSNPLILGITAGLAVNITNTPVPAPITAAVDLMSASAIPAALFGLGGVLVRYKPEGDWRVIGFTLCATLLIHPAVTYLLASGAFKLEIGALRSATLTASMAPGVNAYLFANMYGAGKRVAASSVLLGTALSLFTIWCWLAVLP
jgi:predicted permease